MRLIDADALKQELQWCLEQSSDTDRWRDVISRVDAVPTVEPKRGRWVEDDHILVCSECEGVAMQRVYYSLTHNATDIPMVKTPYCPHCGAKMEGGEDDAGND